MMKDRVNNIVSYIQSIRDAANARSVRGCLSLFRQDILDGNPLRGRILAIFVAEYFGVETTAEERAKCSYMSANDFIHWLHKHPDVPHDASVLGVIEAYESYFNLPTSVKEPAKSKKFWFPIKPISTVAGMES